MSLRITPYGDAWHIKTHYLIRAHSGAGYTMVQDATMLLCARGLRIVTLMEGGGGGLF